MEWYYASDAGEQIGPATEDQIKKLIDDGQVTSSTPVWNDTMEDWQDLSTTALASLVKKGPPPIKPKTQPAPSQPMPGVATGNDMEASFSRDPNKIYASNPPKSIFLVWLNLLWPGIAQIALGQTAKGVTFALVTIPLLCNGIGVFIMIASIVDALFVVKTLQSGQPVGQWRFFPNFFKWWKENWVDFLGGDLW